MENQENIVIKKFYKRPWFIVLAILILLILIGSSNDQPSTQSQTSETPIKEEPADTSEPESDTAEPRVAPEYRSALVKAESYANTMHMSKKGVYGQLTSEYGEKFTPEAAQYAVDNVKADWNLNALAKAKSYQDTMSMSPAAIRDQLVSEYGEKFTEAEADYAIQHLND